MARPFSARSIFIACLVLVVLVLWALTVHSQSELQVEYATINADETSSLPVATALFSFRNAQGILVAEVGVEAVEPIRRGRIFVDQDGTRTGLALANSGDQSVTAALILRNAAGLEIDQSQLILEPREHIAVFVDELFPGALEDLTGSLTFETEAEEQRLAAVTLRQSNNVHGEPLLATLPVADLSELIAAATLQAPDSIVFPHIGAGASPNVILSTQIVLINPSSERLSGEIRLTASDGTPLQGELGGMVGSEFAYELEPEGTYRTTLTSSQAVVTGYAVVSLEEGSVLPVGTAIFQFRDDGGSLVSEAGVGATLPTTRARIFVDTVRTETGVAIASPGNDASTVTFELLDRNGFSIDSVDIEIPAAGHLALFANELFLLPLGFTGLMEIRSQVPMVPITLKLTTNQRGDSILTTLPVADLMRPSGATSLVIPQVGFGPDFSTRLIFIGTETEGRSRGHIVFTQSNGTELVVPVLGQASSDFPYLINPGGASQLRPGNTATVAEIVLDPSEPGLSEVVVNTGNTILLRPQILDTEGEFRDDFVLAYNSLDTGVATVDEVGSVTGGEQGFSTLTVSVEGVLRTATITVVKVTSGVSGFDITGVVQDLAQRRYLTSTANHTVLRTDSLQAPPDLYAGISQAPGLTNGERLDSMFNAPAFLAIDQLDGTLYVTDGGNHLIRKVNPGPNGRVTALAGTGQPGSGDGEHHVAAFNNPQGVALDDRGNLWIADTGNHTIRKIELGSGLVTTIAGQPGSPGLADGVGEGARFNSPVGIAVEREPLGQQLERESRGEAPPPVTVIVADTGNSLLRKVDENGRVDTVGSTSGSPTSLILARRSLLHDSAKTAAVFESPVGVAVDSLGNIYVTDSEAGEVRTILRTGVVVAAVQSNTLARIMQEP